MIFFHKNQKEDYEIELIKEETKIKKYWNDIIAHLRTPSGSIELANI